MKIINQYDCHDIIELTKIAHMRTMDFNDGDLLERLWEYDYFNDVIDFDLKKLSTTEFDVDEDKVEDYRKLIREIGYEKMPPIIIKKKRTGYEIIDGIHRLNALIKEGIEYTAVLIGSNKKWEPEFEIKTTNEELKIRKFYNEFGSIEIMEDAMYSPAQNSISSFFVDEKYRGHDVGVLLLKEVMKHYEDIGAQVSSIKSLKTFAKCGFVPKGFDEINEEMLKQVNQKSHKIYRDYTEEDYMNLTNGKKILRINNGYNSIIDKFIEKFKENGGSLFVRLNENGLYLKNKKTTKYRI